MVCIIPPSRHASFHEKMFLRAVLAEFRRSGIEETTFKMASQQLNILYRGDGEVTRFKSLFPFVPLVPAT